MLNKVCMEYALADDDYLSGYTMWDALADDDYLAGYQDAVKQAAAPMTLAQGVKLARRARRLGILTGEASQAMGISLTTKKSKRKRRRRRR